MHEDGLAHPSALVLPGSPSQVDPESRAHLGPLGVLHCYAGKGGAGLVAKRTCPASSLS